MKHVVIDLEMNEIKKEFKQIRKDCRMEIIQIGAVVLDENYKEIGSFSTLVKPQYNDKIDPFFQELTHITTDMVQNAPIFEEALYSFFCWIQSFQDEVDILAWSDNDLYQVLAESYVKEYAFTSYEEELLERWYDFQKEYCHTLMLDYPISLNHAIVQANLSFVGMQHNALYDAKNTAALLALLRDEKRCANTFGIILEAKRVQPCTLGDLFDFSQFVFD